MLRDLMLSGIAMSDVARACGRSPTTVQAWAEGSEPKESDARIVLALLARYCPEAYAVHEREYAIRLPAVAKLSES
ncbi:MAG: hypothetical protein KBC73_13170 [Burkholderiaceae bacterium]|nr:hypothetical protein [Burkholderiaceae bacterium]